METIAAVQVYNNIGTDASQECNYGTILVDTRSVLDICTAGSIASSLLLPPPAVMPTATMEMKALINHLVVENQRVEMELLLASDCPIHVILVDEVPYSVWALVVYQSLKECPRISKIEILRNGYKKFLDKWRMLCRVEYSALEDQSLSATNVCGKRLPSYPSCVEDGFLYLGKASQSADGEILETLGITHVLNCASNEQTRLFEKRGIVYYHMKIEGMGDIVQKASVAFDDAYAFMERAKRTEKGKLLVHSTNGKSRCCSLVVFFTMKYKQIALVEAYQIVRSHRPTMSPKEAIVELLRQKEIDMHGSSSVKGTDVELLIQGKTIKKLSLQEQVDNLVVDIDDASFLQSHRVIPQQVVVSKKPEGGRVVRIQNVNGSWLYNRLQVDSGMMLLDARPRGAFEHATIFSAVSIPPPMNTQESIDMQWVENALLPEQKFIFVKRKLVEIVLFVDAGDISNTSSWIWKLGQLFVSEGVVSSVKFMEEGYTTFSHRYPFLTTEFDLDGTLLQSKLVMRTLSGTHTVTYPNEILGGFLYLGNMWQASQDAVIQNLHITHVVNASMDVANLFSTKGVKYFNVSIKDRTDSDISVYFEPTFHFMEEAKRHPESRILVHCTQGVSRSATLVVYYLMKNRGWSMVTAMNHTLSCRGVAYPNLGFLRQLMSAELGLYKANSLDETEFDMLLQGCIPNRPVPLPCMIDRESRINMQHKCNVCDTVFSLLSVRRHTCKCCQRTVCSRCSGARIVVEDTSSDSHQARRVCNVCIGRLWYVVLPNKSKRELQKSMTVKKSGCNIHQPFTIYYWEGTDPQVLIDLLSIRYKVGSTDVISLILENGENVDLRYEKLAQNVVMFISIGSEAKKNTHSR